MHDRRARRVLVASMAAGTILLGCAFNRPSEDEGNPETGAPPPGITSAPATPSTGPVTSPLPLVADQTPRPDRMPVGTMSAAGEPRAMAIDSVTRELSARLDTVIGATDRGLTRMSPQTALAVTGGIQRFLESRENPRLRPVILQLEVLRTELQRSPIDARATGVALQRLGERTAAVAPAAGVLAGRVARLADGLRAEGTKLAGGR